MKTYPIITISRECGSGGHEIAELLSKKLELPLYDNELLTIAAKESGYAPEVIANAETSHTSRLGITLDAYTTDQYYSVPLNNRLFSVQASIIRTIAARESAIIVGRCADAILRDYAPCVNIFIQGSKVNRIHRIMKRDGTNYNDSEKQMRRVDKARETYYDFYTDGRWGGRKNYDLMISSDIGLEATADIIAAFVKNALPVAVKQAEGNPGAITAD